MKASDLDGSGTIDSAEFRAATMMISYFIKEEEMKAAFKHFDKQNTEYLTPQGILSSINKTKNSSKEVDSLEQAQKMFEDIGKTGEDAKISFEEFRDMINSYMNTLDKNWNLWQ